MVLRTMMYCGGRPRKVRIIEPDGQPRHFCARITVRDLLLRYPRHYCLRDVSGSILSTDAELEGGSTYLLMPLPRQGRGSNRQPAPYKGAWKPSLDRIAENTTLSLEEKKVWAAKKEEIKAVKHRKSSPFSWERESPMSMAYFVPSGFIF